MPSPPRSAADSRSIRVLYVIDSLVPAGAERSLAELVPHYIALGVAIDVAYLKERPGVHRELQAAGARLISLDGRGGWLARIRRAQSLLRREQPDLVHTTLFEADIIGRIAARAAQVPVVSSLVSIAYGPEQMRDPRLALWKVRAAQIADAATARVVTRFHALTEHVARVMGRRLGIRGDRIDIVPRGRDPGRLGEPSAERTERIRSALDVSPRDALILAVARHEYQKTSVGSLAQDIGHSFDQDVEALLVAGREGNETAALRQAIERLRVGDSVALVGSRLDVPDLLCAADMLAAPSRWEGLGGVLLEAMALELPIVASDIPPFREIVPSQVVAAFVTPERPQALGSAIVQTLLHPASARASAQRARELFRARFSIEQVAPRMLEFYERALTDAGHPEDPTPSGSR